MMYSQCAVLPCLVMTSPRANGAYCRRSATSDFSLPESPENRATLPSISRRLEMLGKVALFSGLSGNEKSEVAERLQYAPFARGDVITKQGNTAHWLYIMAFGDAEVLYEPPSGPPQVLALLRPGQFFGEMALMAGDARTATVVAKTDVECWRLDRG